MVLNVIDNDCNDMTTIPYNLNILTKYIIDRSIVDLLFISKNFVVVVVVVVVGLFFSSY